MSAIHHAWTVACRRSLVDGDTGDTALEVLDAIDVPAAVATTTATLAIPQRLDVVSLWWRDDATAPAIDQARLAWHDPRGARLAEARLVVGFASGQRRLRTRHIFETIGVAGVGTHELIVHLGEAGGVVARIPVEVRAPGRDAMAPAERGATDPRARPG